MVDAGLERMERHVGGKILWWAVGRATRAIPASHIPVAHDEFALIQRLADLFGGLRFGYILHEMLSVHVAISMTQCEVGVPTDQSNQRKLQVTLSSTSLGRHSSSLFYLYTRTYRTDKSRLLLEYQLINVQCWVDGRAHMHPLSRDWPDCRNLKATVHHHRLSTSPLHCAGLLVRKLPVLVGSLQFCLRAGLFRPGQLSTNCGVVAKLSSGTTTPKYQLNPPNSSPRIPAPIEVALSGYIPRNTPSWQLHKGVTLLRKGTVSRPTAPPIPRNRHSRRSPHRARHPRPPVVAKSEHMLVRPLGLDLVPMLPLAVSQQQAVRTGHTPSNRKPPNISSQRMAPTRV